METDRWTAGTEASEVLKSPFSPDVSLALVAYLSTVGSVCGVIDLILQLACAALISFSPTERACGWHGAHYNDPPSQPAACQVTNDLGGPCSLHSPLSLFLYFFICFNFYQLKSLKSALLA
jgi:hypothetical protein